MGHAHLEDLGARSRPGFGARHRLTLAATLALLLAACAGPTEPAPGAEGEVPEGPVTQCPEGITVSDDVLCGVPTIGPAPDGVLTPPDAPFEDPTLIDPDEGQPAYFLSQEGEGKVYIFVDETVRVGVRAVDLVGQPAEGHRITFEIEEPEGAPPSGARLQAQASATNTFGVANVELTGGPQPSFFFLRMTAPDSTSLTYQVNVVQRPDGYDPVVDPNDPNGPIDPIGPVGKCLQTAGTYSIKNAYEPARFLGDGVFNALDLINRALSDPGQLVGEYIEDRIDGIWGSLIRGVIDPVIDYLYRYVVDNYAPEWVRWMLTLTEDISSILVELEIEGQMVLGSTDADCALSGTHEWTTLVFYWRAGCAANAPACGRHEIPLAQLGAGLSRSQFTARVTRTIGPVSSMEIDQHAMQLNLGVAVIWFVQNVILQQRFNVSSFGELLQMVVPCDAVGQLAADYVGGSVFGFAVAPFVESACEAGMRAAGNYLTGLLTDQLQVSAFDMAGTCNLRDSNGDQSADLIEEGRWTQGLEGDFTGQRL